MKIPRNILTISWAVGVFIVTACTETPQIILTNQENTQQLVYSCNDIQPQAESIDEIKIIFRYVPEVGMALQQNQQFATLQQLSRGDIKTKEFIVVEFFCENPKK